MQCNEMQCNAETKTKQDTKDTSLRTFPLIRPQLSTTIPLSTETLDSTRIDLLSTATAIIPHSPGIVVEC